ncbi:ABC transporter ATP-binding protein [Marinococcus sp. PL1-022]|uniref:ABC transporter ATP-binding protein n=1 Tax=Marinococcus sp. PL1-022 TaxID=3095363 RepID=UPI0029C16A05|nr:ABC transporter ATP-binding protein [Marinococcus sp. PL1-022]MDX6152723.1 ABC transporter ATP-binding protein [Marinococcus sp. PL1-022]
MNQHPVLQLEGLTKSIQKTTVVHPLNLQVHAGEVFGFIGPNGAGKTTTIRMILGLVKATEGDVYIAGENVRTNFLTAISSVGGIIESPEMYDFLTGEQNLKHYARLAGNASATNIRDAAERTGIAYALKRKLKTYSLGMKQRLGLAQALLHQPKLLILDEPTNGLDPAGIRELRHYLRRLAEQEQMAVFISSHQLSDMEQMCDRIGIIHQGRLVDVQPVQSFVQGDRQKQAVTIVTNQPREASTALKPFTQEQTAVMDAFSVRVSLSPDDVPQCIATLVEHGIRIYEVSPHHHSLEDQFLKVTNGGA